MKNRILKTILICLITLTSTHISAQEFHFMPKVGFSLSTIMGLDAQTRSGINVGIGVEYLFPNDKFALEAGTYYSMQGASQKKKLLGEYITGKINNDYINIPIYAKMYVYKGLNIFAGPQVGFKIHNSFTLEGNKQKYETLNIDELFYPIDFSLVIGGGYALENGLFFSLNYNFGLTDILKYKDVEIEGETAYLQLMTDDGIVRNGVFQANIGWRF